MQDVGDKQLEKKSLKLTTEWLPASPALLKKLDTSALKLEFGLKRKNTWFITDLSCNNFQMNSTFCQDSSSVFGTACIKYVQKHFQRQNLCALQVFLGALLSRLVCAHTRAHLRGNIDSNSGDAVWVDNIRIIVWINDYQKCLVETRVDSARVVGPKGLPFRPSPPAGAPACSQTDPKGSAYEGFPSPAPNSHISIIHSFRSNNQIILNKFHLNPFYLFYFTTTISP